MCQDYLIFLIRIIRKFTSLRRNYPSICKNLQQAHIVAPTGKLWLYLGRYHPYRPQKMSSDAWHWTRLRLGGYYIITWPPMSILIASIVHPRRADRGSIRGSVRPSSAPRGEWYFPDDVMTRYYSIQFLIFSVIASAPILQVPTFRVWGGADRRVSTATFVNKEITIKFLQFTSLRSTYPSVCKNLQTFRLPTTYNR